MWNNETFYMKFIKGDAGGGETLVASFGLLWWLIPQLYYFKAQCLAVFTSWCVVGHFRQKLSLYFWFQLTWLSQQWFVAVSRTDWSCLTPPSTVHGHAALRMHQWTSAPRHLIIQHYFSLAHHLKTSEFFYIRQMWCRCELSACKHMKNTWTAV